MTPSVTPLLLPISNAAGDFSAPLEMQTKTGVMRLFDRPKHRKRNIIERMFCWLKESCWIVTRFDKLARSYAAMVSLSCAMRCLEHYTPYRTCNDDACSI